MTSEFAYVMAAEQIGKIEVPKRAQYLRVITAELQRVASHLLWLGTWCMDMGGALGGGATIFLYCIRERESILDLFEALVGARLLYGFYQVGGARYDLPPGWADQCRKTIDVIDQRIGEVRAASRTTRSSCARARRRRDLARSPRMSASPGRCCAARVSASTSAGPRRTPPTRTSTSTCPSRPTATASRATACGWWSSGSRSGSCGRRWTGCPKARFRRGPG